MDTSQPERETPRPMLQGPKRQHFVPQWYQEGFVANDGCIAVYDRNTDSVRRQRPVNTGVTGHLYTLTDELGRKRFELEHLLSQIEGAAAEHWPTLLREGTVSPEARGAIALFVGVLSARTPDFIQSIQLANNSVMQRLNRVIFSNHSQVAMQLRDRPENQGKSETEIAEMATDLVNFATGDNYVIETDHEWAMTTAVSIGEATAQTLATRHWTIWKAPEGVAFIYSDSPVALTTLAPRPPSNLGVGFANADALVIVPLNSEYALAMHQTGGGLNRADVDAQHVNRVNQVLASDAQRYLFAKDDAQVAAVARISRMAERQWQPKIGT